LERSSNVGKSWDSLFFTSKNNFGALVVDSNGVLIVCEYGYIFRSIDKGNSWYKITNGLDSETSYGVPTCGKNGNIYMAAQVQGYSILSHSVHSTDDGLTWSSLPFTQGLFAASPSGRVLFAGTMF